MEVYKQPQIDPSAMIARNASIVGDVHLAEEVVVFHNATLRGDCGWTITVGPRTNIQELACIHVAIDGPTIIGKDVTVGHGAIVHGATIGDRCIVGMGSIVMDHAKIGNDCLIGAGALVTGGTQIPDGMLVIGSPAKAVRPLTDEERAYLLESATDYVETGKALQAQGLL